MTKKWHFIIYTCIWVVALAIGSALLVQNIGDARIINYSGIVRGATQKLVKEELNGYADDALIAQLDGIIENLQTGKGEFHLRKSGSKAFQQKLSELKTIWEQMKAQIAQLRLEREETFLNGEQGQLLYEYSQRHFETANELVHIAERYSDVKVWGIIGILAFYLIVTVALFAFFYQRNRKALEHSFTTDRLTDCLNRNGFEKKVLEVTKEAGEARLAILKFDVDDFKFINATYGYEFGDNMLRAIAAQLKAEPYVRAVARIDADDFMVLAAYGDTLIEDLRAALKQSIAGFSDIDVSGAVSVTVGVCGVEAGQTVKAMITKANVAHKSAKNKGKGNTVCYDEDLLETLRRENKLTARMHSALANQEFQMYLQPKFDIRDMKIIGAETLVRWDCPDMGLLYPDSFIPLFEKNGSIFDLDFYMLDKACAFIVNSRARGYQPLPLSVNFSRVTIYHKDFFDSFQATVGKYDVPPHLIEIEITEGAFNGITETMMAGIRKLRSEGYLVSMDDFGSGYSSLNLLNTLHLDTLKLDRDFLRGFSESERSDAKRVINCVVDLAHVLNMSVICEGIETEEHVEFLRAIHCNYGQGYYYSRPIDEQRFIEKFCRSKEEDAQS